MNVTVDDMHRIIDAGNFEDVDLEVNVTPDLIVALESYGYKVIRPGKNIDE